MIKLRFLSVALLATVFTLSLSSCDSTEDPPPQTEESKVLTNIGNNIIVDIYHDLETDSDPLITAVQAFRSSQTQANLDAARQKWLDARVSFELAEAFEWGPVKQNDLKYKLDFWPADESAIAGIIASSTPINQAYVDAQVNGAKGYHGMEFLLWGSDPKNPRSSGSFVARELEYLEALALDHKVKANELHEAWDPNGGNYVKNLTKAGTSESIYPTEKEALHEVVEGLAHICEELQEEYIKGPYDAADPRMLESYYSNSSGSDFYNIILGVQKVYTGVHGSSTGLGVSHLVSAKKLDLDDSVKEQISYSLTMLNEVKADMNDAVVSSSGRPKVAACIEAIKQLYRLIDDRVVVVLFN